jgi:hypothetical protein
MSKEYPESWIDRWNCSSSGDYCDRMREESAVGRDQQISGEPFTLAGVMAVNFLVGLFLGRRRRFFTKNHGQRNIDVQALDALV